MENSEKQRINALKKAEKKAERKRIRAEKRAKEREFRKNLPPVDKFQLLAFGAILFYAISLVFGVVAGWLSGVVFIQYVNQVLKFIAELFILLTLAIPATKFVHKRGTKLLVVYIVVLVIFVLGACGSIVTEIMKLL